MKPCDSFAEVPQGLLLADESVSEVPGLLSAREIQSIRERADRLYRMGELAAAAELLVTPGVLQ